MPVHELLQTQLKVAEPQAPLPLPVVIPPPEKGRGPWWPWLALAAPMALAVGIYFLVTPERSAPVPGDIPKVAVAARPIHHTIRVTGITQAARYASIMPPRLPGSRSGRGRSGGGDLIQANSIVTVQSTSTVASSSTTSSLTATGSVTSTADSGGGVSGAPSGASSALQAATSRVGGSGAATGGNVTTTTSAPSTTASTSAASSTASDTGTGGTPGGGRSRGDFHMALRKLLPAGTQVSAGDVIAEFDRQYMTTRMDDYLAAVAQVEASYRKGQSDLMVEASAHTQSILSAKGTLDKARLDVKAAPVLSAITAEKLRLAVEEAESAWKQLSAETPYLDISKEAQLRAAEIEVRQAQVELDRARTNLDKLVIRSPIDGMVVRLDIFSGGEYRRVKVGDDLQPGMPFVKVVDTSSMIVDAMVNQVDIDRMRIGQKAIARFDAFPGLELPATLHAIGTVAKARQFRREYVTEVPIQLKLDATDARVIPDLSVAADIILETSEAPGVVAPLEAVRIARESAGTGTVYVETPQGWQRRDVTLGVRNHVEVIILSGLETGDVVALTHWLSWWRGE